MKSITNCSSCKRPILDHEVNEKEGIAYCVGCNLYFPIESRVKRKREEIIVPNGTSYIRLRIERDALEIKIKWFGNYSWTQITTELFGEELQFALSIVAYLINKTTISVDRQIFKIEHKPIDELLPFVYYNSSYVKQLYVKKTGMFFKTYGLFAALGDGREVRLIWNLDKTVLLFIEQEIERVLGIEDRAIEGETI